MLGVGVAGRAGGMFLIFACACCCRCDETLFFGLLLSSSRICCTCRKLMKTMAGKSESSLHHATYVTSTA